MALPSDLKMGKCFEWYTELPHLNRPRISQTFLFQNTECYFQLSNDGKFYDLYLAAKKASAKREDVSFAIYAFYSNTYIRKEHYFNWLHTGISVLKFNELSFTSPVQNLSDRTFIRFVFMFENSIVPSLPFVTKIEDKTIQTVSYLTDDVSMKSLSEDFSKFLDMGLYHDVEIRCGEHTAKAHKIVMCARSDVFKAMLETDMQEGRTGIVQIHDMDVNYFQDFIRYLYTALIPELDFEKAKSLYGIGDKYAVRSLMHQCSEYLQDNISAENAFDCLVLADAHSDQKLEDGITTYIVDKKLYLQDEYWAPFCDRFPKIAIKVYKLSHEKIEGHCEKKMKVF